jgi:hypothetical protein
MSSVFTVFLPFPASNLVDHMKINRNTTHLRISRINAVIRPAAPSRNDGTLFG